MYGLKRDRLTLNSGHAGADERKWLYLTSFVRRSHRLEVVVTVSTTLERYFQID
jgi:hypothetical protein